MENTVRTVIRNTPIRVLHIAGTMAPGGIETFLVNLHGHIDPSRMTFDYAVHAQADGAYAKRVKELGAQVYLLPRLSSAPLANFKEVGRLVRENRYDVVVRHTPNAMITPQLIAAKKNGARTICHAHNESDPMKAAHFAGRLLMDRAADMRIACSEGAGRWMFGNRPFVVMKNAIDVANFAYRTEREERIREAFGLKHAHVYGHIANFRPEKNHAYLLEVFRFIKDADPDAVLLCLGDGPLRPEIEAQIREKGLDKRVILAGTRNDVADIMCAMDVLLFPSVFEGLPVTLIEAQAACLPVLLSENITKDVEVTDGLLSFYSIDVPPADWANKAAAMMRETLSHPKQEYRIPQTEKIAAHGYDMATMCETYQDLIEKLALDKTGTGNGDK